MYQKAVLEKLSAATGESKEQPVAKRRKKRAKGPNPLSVKKSSKVVSRGRARPLKSGVTQSKVCQSILFSDFYAIYSIFLFICLLEEEKQTANQEGYRSPLSGISED